MVRKYTRTYLAPLAASSSITGRVFFCLKCSVMPIDKVKLKILHVIAAKEEPNVTLLVICMIVAM